MSAIDSSGVALATALAQHGIRAVMLDRQPQGGHTSRAAIAYAQAVELLVTTGDTVGMPLIARSWPRSS